VNGQRTSLARSRGIALFAVLMLLLLATVLASSAAVLAWSNAADGAQLRSQLEQRANTDSALAYLTLRIRLSETPETLRAGSTLTLGRPWVMQPVSLTLEEESGRIDLNRASDAVLGAYFQSRGATLAVTERWIATLRDWQDADDIARLGGAEFVEYRNARAAAQPRNAAFASVPEVFRLKKMAGIDLACVSEDFTVASFAPEPNAAFLTPGVRRAYAWADKTQWDGRRWALSSAASETSSWVGRVLRVSMRPASERSDEKKDDNVAPSTSFVVRVSSLATDAPQVFRWRDAVTLTTAACASADSP
jgi:general secretion pathway protein K